MLLAAAFLALGKSVLTQVLLNIPDNIEIQMEILPAHRYLRAMNCPFWIG